MIGRLAWNIGFGFLFCLVVGLQSVTTAEAEANVQVEVSPQSATIDDAFVVTVRVSSSEAGSLEAPEFERSGEFTAGSTNRSTQLSMVNGVTSYVQTFDIEFRPSSNLKPGAYTLPRGYWEVNGERVFLKTLKVHIVPPRPEEKLAAFAQVVDNVAPYVGQQIVYRAEAATKHELVETVLDEIPFSGFLRQSFGRQRELIRRIGYGNTTVYTVREALFPTRAGKVVIDGRGAVLRFQLPERGSSSSRLRDFPRLFPDIFDRVVEKRQRMNSLPIELDVRPLPPTEIPWKGTVPVGEVSLGFSFSKNTVTLGDSIELRIELRGDADLRSVGVPLRDSIDAHQFKIYEQEPSVGSTIRDERVEFVKVFEYALLPLKAGNLRIPPIHVLTFDPSLKDYRILEVPEQQIDVRPTSDGKHELSAEERSPAGPTDTPLTPDAPEPKTLDVAPYAPLRVASGFELPPLSAAVMTTVLVGVPIILFLAAYSRRFLAPDKRRFRQLRRAMKRFRKMIRAGKDTRHAVSALREFAESWFGSQALSWTDTELEERFLQAGFRSTTIQLLHEFHISVAPILYGAGKRESGNDEYRSSVASLSEALLSDADALLRRPAAGRPLKTLTSMLCLLLAGGCHSSEPTAAFRDHDEALTYFEKRVDEAPSNVSLLNNVGVLQALSDSDHQAFVTLYRALQIAPTDAQLRSNFEVLLRTAQFQIVEAERAAPEKLVAIRDALTLRGLEYGFTLLWIGAAAVLLLGSSTRSRAFGVVLILFALTTATARYGISIHPNGAPIYSPPWSRPYFAFVTVPNTIVYSEPTVEKGQRIAVFTGHEIFQVVGERDGWLNIRYGSRRVGWIRAEYFRYLPRVL